MFRGIPSALETKISRGRVQCPINQLQILFLPSLLTSGDLLQKKLILLRQSANSANSNVYIRLDKVRRVRPRQPVLLNAGTLRSKSRFFWRDQPVRVFDDFYRRCCIGNANSHHVSGLRLDWLVDLIRSWYLPCQGSDTQGDSCLLMSQTTSSKNQNR